MQYLISHVIFIGQGLILTLGLLLGGILLGGILGALLTLARFNGIGRPIIAGFISLIRGTPLILQLSILYFALPQLIGVSLNVVTVGILTFGINSSAYIAEILRAGLENIPKGQFEAAKVLNIPPLFLWKDIILPQVLNNTLPALVNEVIALLKETALISTLGGLDLMRRSQLIAAEQFSYFTPLCLAALYYFSLVLVFEHIGEKLAIRWHYVKA